MTDRRKPDNTEEKRKLESEREKVTRKKKQCVKRNRLNREESYNLVCCREVAVFF